MTAPAAGDQPRRRSASADAAALRDFESELLEADIQLPPPFVRQPAAPPRRSAQADGAALRAAGDDGAVIDLPRTAPPGRRAA